LDDKVELSITIGLHNARSLLLCSKAQKKLLMCFRISNLQEDSAILRITTDPHLILWDALEVVLHGYCFCNIQKQHDNSCDRHRLVPTSSLQEHTVDLSITIETLMSLWRYFAASESRETCNPTGADRFLLHSAGGQV
jgi:hypothetical protein